MDYLFDESKVHELLTYSTDKRLHIMKALSSLSKFCGKNDEWKLILKKYNITWSTANTTAGEYNLMFDNVFNNGYLHMIEEVRKLIRLLKPLGKSNIILFNVLTGLRPQEAIDSYNLLLSEKRDFYLSENKKLLQHYKYPDLFFRRTKKAFISIINDNILSLAGENKTPPLTYNSLRLFTNRNKEQFKMSYCRKIFATFLRNEGVELEIIDLLQGRSPTSVFARHYYRPPMEKFENIRNKLSKLYNMINEK